jgi:hypothetical protein
MIVRILSTECYAVISTYGGAKAYALNSDSSTQNATAF